MKDAFADTGTSFSSIGEALLATVALAEIRQNPCRSCGQIIDEVQRPIRLARGSALIPAVEMSAFDANINTAFDATFDSLAAEPKVEPIVESAAEPEAAPPILERDSMAHAPDMIFGAGASPVQPSLSLTLGNRDFASLVLAAALLSLGTQYLLFSAGFGPG